MKRKTKPGRKSKAEIALLTRTGMIPKKAGFTWADLEGQTITKVLSVDGDSMKLQLSNGSTFFVQGHGPVAFNFVTEMKTVTDFYHEMPNFNDGRTSSILQCVQTAVPEGLTEGKTVSDYATVSSTETGLNTISLLRIPYKEKRAEGKGTDAGTSTVATTNQ